MPTPTGWPALTRTPTGWAADALADAEALADADGSADALGLAEGVAVRRPPLPSSRALRKIATNTATVAITKTFE